jgi:hypothetical protein
MSISSVFVIPADPLWDHFKACWAHSFGYEQAVSYDFKFTRRTFDVAMQACNDDYDAYLFKHDRAEWRRGVPS